MPILPDINLDKVLPNTYGIPAGDHLAELTRVEEIDSKHSGLPMWVWFWDIKEGPATRREIVSFTDNGTGVNHPRLVDALHNHLRVMGITDEGHVGNDKYKGKKAVLMIVIHKKKGSKGEGFPYVDRILPPQAAHLK